MKKLVRESLIEGVADKYLEQRFGIPDPTRAFDKQYNEGKGEYVGRVCNKFDAYSNDCSRLFKNPQSLENFDNDVRGILLSNGDLYFLEKMVNVKHEDIKFFLHKSGIISIVNDEGDDRDIYKRIIKYNGKSSYGRGDNDINVEGILNIAEVERKGRTDIMENGLLRHENTQSIFDKANKVHKNLTFKYI